MIPSCIGVAGRLMLRCVPAICFVAACGDPITGLPDPRDARPIVYFRIDNDWSLYRISSAGSAPTRLNLPITTTLFPALSPDGSQLAFVSESSPGGVYVGSADGSGARRVYPSTTIHITWSPDATKLAIGVNGEIVIVPLDGSAADTITKGIDVWADYPSWSSTGRIAFSTREQFYSLGDIYTMATDGSGLRLIVPGEGTDARDPAWSPDGSRLAFAHGQYAASAIFTVDPNGNDRRRVTPEAEWGFGWTDLAPTWAPSGQWIAFQRDHFLCAGTNCESRYDVMVVPAEGGDVRNVTAGSPWGGIGPTW